MGGASSEDSDPDWDEQEEQGFKNDKGAASSPAPQKRKEKSASPGPRRRQTRSQASSLPQNQRQKKGTAVSPSIQKRKRRKWEDASASPSERLGEEENATPHISARRRSSRGVGTSSQSKRRGKRKDSPLRSEGQQAGEGNLTPPAKQKRKKVAFPSRSAAGREEEKCEERSPQTHGSRTKKGKRKTEGPSPDSPGNAKSPSPMALPSERKVAFKGVSKSTSRAKGKQQWMSMLYLGMRARRRVRYCVSASFSTPEEAAQGYDRAAIAILGPDHAVTNFPLETYGPEARKLEGEELHSFLAEIKSEALTRTKGKKTPARAGMTVTGRNPRKNAAVNNIRAWTCSDKNPNRRCGVCLNCVTKSGHGCLKNKARKQAGEAGTHAPAPSRAPKPMSAQAVAKKMAERYEEQEKSRLAASISRGHAEGEDRFVRGSSPFQPMGTAEASEADLQHDYFQDLAAVGRGCCRRALEDQGHSFREPAVTMPCARCNSSRHGKSKCPLLECAEEKSQSAGTQKIKLKRGAKKMLKRYPPHIQKASVALMTANPPMRREIFEGGPLGRKRKQLMGLDAAIACTLILDEVIETIKGPAWG